MRWVNLIGRLLLASAIVLAILIQPACRPNQVYYRLESPDRTCAVIAEIAGSGFLGSRARLRCGMRSVILRQLYKDFEPGTAFVDWRMPGESTAVLCNLYGGAAVLEFETPSGVNRMREPSDGAYREAAARLRTAHPLLPPTPAEESIRSFCTDETLARAFKQQHPTRCY